MSSTIVVNYPECHFCKKEEKKEPARYDARTKDDVWFYICEQHFKEHGVGLGLGRGQLLVLEWHKQCPILTSHHVRKDGKCIRFATCQTEGHTTDPRCQARGQV